MNLQFPSPRRNTPFGSGFYPLFLKETRRFWRVGFQTVLAPVLTAWLYLLVFGHLLESRVAGFHGIAYSAFLIPGLVMMSVLQNSFANSSSSLIQSKITGNLIFLLLSPISYMTIFNSYIAAAVIRGMVVGSGVFILGLFYVDIAIFNPFWILAFSILGAALLGSLGLIAGLWADKFDQLAAFQNFIILPATFLSGVFYSVTGLSEVWQTISHLNPFFYIIDGFRYGFFGVSDISPNISIVVVLSTTGLSAITSIFLLKKGYKIRQ